MGGGKQMERQRLAKLDRGLLPFEIKTFEGMPKFKILNIIVERGSTEIFNGVSKKQLLLELKNPRPNYDPNNDDNIYGSNLSNFGNSEGPGSPSTISSSDFCIVNMSSDDE